MCDASGKELLQKVTRYIYDDNGNELRQSVSYICPANVTVRQTTGGSVYSNSVTGSIETLIEKTSSTFDGFNRLEKTDNIKAGVRTFAEYTYNGDDLRVKKVVMKSSNNYTPEITNYLYDRQRVILETDEYDNVKVRYIRSVNYIGRMDVSGKLSYFMYNGHGDVTALVGTDGTVAGTYYYDAFGNILEHTGIDSNITYSGYQYDGQTNLYYLNARYYDPKIARFLSEDSYAGKHDDPLSLNLYTYCHNDPINYTDPSGHVEVGLRTYTESKGATVSWNSTTGTASVTMNGTTRNFDIKDYKVENGHIMLDSSAIDKAFSTSVTLFQHGVNADRNTFTKMTNDLTNNNKDNNVINLGVMTKNGVDFNEINKTEINRVSSLGIKIDKNSDYKAIVDKLLTKGYNVIFRTEFSNPTGEHYEQIKELSQMVNMVTYNTEKVNLVGHSKGGLVSIAYTAYNTDRVKSVTTIDTPYAPNFYARASVLMMDKAHDAYVSAKEKYDNKQNWWNKKVLDSATLAFYEAMKQGTRGSQLDYDKIGGLRDLAGQTDALSNIRDEWNTKYANGNLRGISVIALATDSYDKKRYGVNLSDENGDMIVSLSSQRGTGFDGVFPITYTATGDNRNTEAYSHTGICNQDVMINIVGTALGFR